MRALPTLILLSLSSVLSGCMAVKGTIRVLQAEQAVERAQERGAQRYAVYEYTLAVRYLEKSREELGDNEYRISEDLATAAAGFADQAVISMSERGVGGIDLDASGLPDATGPAAYVPQVTGSTVPGAAAAGVAPPEPVKDDEDYVPPTDDPWKDLQ